MMASQERPGFINLFKGVIRNRLRRLRDPNNGIIDMAVLMSNPPTDFLFHLFGGYFAVDRDVAVRYAFWARRRSHGSPAAIVQITVPISAIQSIPEGQLHHIHWDPSGNNKTWEKLVYYSRNRQRGPRDLRQSLNSPTLIIGTIANYPNFVYHRMRSYEEITEGHILKNNEGQPAIQYVWTGLDGFNFLQDHCCQNLQVFPVTRADISALIW